MTQTDKFSERLLAKIEQQQIAPKPKWHFIVREVLLWLAGILFLTVSSLAFSLIFYLWRNSDWDIRAMITPGPLGLIFLSLPYFWIISLLLFVLVAQYYFKHTKQGYKHQMWLLLAGIVLISLIGGLFLDNLGFNRPIDDILYRHLPFYGKMNAHPRERWHDPTMGRVAGKIMELANSQFTLAEFNGELWLIKFDASTQREQVILEVGEVVRVIGQPQADQVIFARMILPAPPILNNPDLPAPRMLFRLKQLRDCASGDCVATGLPIK